MEGGAEEEGLEKEDRRSVLISSKLFHLVGEYTGDLVSQEAEASSCQEGLGASGRVTNLALETEGLGRVNWGWFNLGWNVFGGLSLAWDLEDGPRSGVPILLDYLILLQLEHGFQGCVLYKIWLKFEWFHENSVISILVSLFKMEIINNMQKFVLK